MKRKHLHTLVHSCAPCTYEPTHAYFREKTKQQRNKTACWRFDETGLKIDSWYQIDSGRKVFTTSEVTVVALFFVILHNVIGAWRHTVGSRNMVAVVYWSLTRIKKYTNDISEALWLPSSHSGGAVVLRKSHLHIFDQKTPSTCTMHQKWSLRSFMATPAMFAQLFCKGKAKCQAKQAPGQVANAAIKHPSFLLHESLPAQLH